MLRKALQNVVAIARSLSDRTHSVVCTLQRQSFEAGKVGYLSDLRKLLDWIISHVQILQMDLAGEIFNARNHVRRQVEFLQSDTVFKARYLFYFITVEMQLFKKAAISQVLDL